MKNYRTKKKINEKDLIKQLASKIAARGISSLSEKESSVLLILRTAKQSEKSDSLSPLHTTETMLSGLRHPLQGKPEYKDFYNSTTWRKLRYIALKNSGASCQCCGAKAGNGVQLHVDHIKPRSRFPELELCLDNLQILCGDCNIGKGAWDATDWRQK